VARALANKQGVISLRKVVEKGKYLALCGELILRLRAGQKTILDFKYINEEQLSDIVDSIAPIYEVFEHDKISDLLSNMNMPKDVGYFYAASIRNIREVVGMAHELKGVTDVVRPIILRAFREFNTEYIRWLSNYLEYPIYFYGVDLNAVDEEGMREGYYHRGKRTECTRA
jgi:hypothetical protein